MTIRGRVDVYCTESESTFIAVASSAELNDSGRPAVVRLVEFQATDPLYKATRIGDFSDFEFRATELHDETMNLAQVQQLWDRIPEDARWWPVKPYGSIPLRSADLIYATLGPMATDELLQALRSSPDNKSESTEQLIEGLDNALGRRPSMLIALTAIIGAAQRFESGGFDGLDRHRGTAVDRFLGESLKHLGGLLLEAGQQFGLDEDDLGPWFESLMPNLFDQTDWPPGQVPYTLEGPQAPGSHLEEPIEIYEVSHGPYSGEPDPEVDSTFLSERRRILARLQTAALSASGVEVLDAPSPVLSINEARPWARLVSATVQAVHNLLADDDAGQTVLRANETFISELCESIGSLPSASWRQLTDARRICFAADLGELLMIAGELGGGDTTGRVAVALAKACGNDPELLSIAEQAGENLPYRNGREDFRWGIEFARNYTSST